MVLSHLGPVVKSHQVVGAQAVIGQHGPDALEPGEATLVAGGCGSAGPLK